MSVTECAGKRAFDPGGARVSNKGFPIHRGDEHVHGDERVRVLTTNVEDVPSYQQKVLLRCLTGPKAGMLRTVTPAHFACRYSPAPAPPGPPPETAGPPL